jgi:hypothetical protein
MSDDQDPTEQNLTGAAGARSHLPGEDGTSGSAAGQVGGGSALDSMGDTELPGESGLDSAGDTFADDQRPDAIRTHDDSAPDDADNPDVLEQADTVLPRDDFGELDADDSDPVVDADGDDDDAPSDDPDQM